MPINAKEDGNVPFIGPRARYSVLHAEPTWVYHKMASGTLDGAAPATAAKTADQLDPAVSPGQAMYDSLTHGGLFTDLGHAGMPLVVEAVDGGATLTLVDKAGNALRNAPTATPFKVGPGEFIKGVGGAKLGLLVRLDGQKVF